MCSKKINQPKNKKLIEMANQLEEFNKNPTKKELTENLKNIIKFRNAQLPKIKQ